MKKLITILFLMLVIGLAIGWIAFTMIERQIPGQKYFGWQTYTSEKYGFQIQLPKSWKVITDTGLAINTRIPVISIYKDQPSFDVHGTSTAVIIYPQGIGTEGIQNKTATSTVHFLEKTKIAWDLPLDNDGPWATVAYFATTTPTWNEFGFVWAGVTIQNEHVSCMRNGKMIREGVCEFGIESEGAEVVRTGTIDQADRDTEVKMLESFKILK